MIDITRIDYTTLDRPDILLYLFHPRPEPRDERPSASGTGHPAPRDILIPVEDEIVVGARFHMAHAAGANLLFFHGNGEIVADYDDLGPVYNRMGMNFLAVDYRGYGRSTGQPTVTAMMRDCHFIFDFVSRWLPRNGYAGPLVVMGRSLGSASVLEIASNYKHQVGGLIVESGFAYAGPLLELLGVDTAALGFEELKGFRNVDKIAVFDKPTLIIHAERDHIIPFADAQALYRACPAPAKVLLKIPAANHNDILIRGATEYMAAVAQLAQKVTARRDDGDPRR
ncbi:MAG: alpha/beta hydrolase [Desulfobacterales bacterium]|nr:MAG: alpha/beta hydrolase [Desulfobacterales bacterium]